MLKGRRGQDTITDDEGEDLLKGNRGDNDELDAADEEGGDDVRGGRGNSDSCQANEGDTVAESCD